MTSFIWKGDDEGGDDFASLFGLTFHVGTPVNCDHLLPHQIEKLRGNPYFTEIPGEAPEPSGWATVSDMKAELMAELDAAGIVYDRRWGPARLKRRLEEAQMTEGQDA